MVQEPRDEIGNYLARIFKLAEQVKSGQVPEDIQTDLPSLLADCILYMKYYMIINLYDNAPLAGPAVDEYESNDFKVGRMKATATLEHLDKLGVLPPA